MAYQTDTGGAPERCLTATRALCNECGRLTEAKTVIADGEVFLVKWCPDHGTTRTLVSSDEAWYLRSLGYVKPGTRPKATAVGSFGGCPTSCGLCPEHAQHTCVPLLEITGACDMDCPICLVGDAPVPHLSVDQVAGIVEGLVRAEGSLNMLTLTGGEPTTHPELMAILDLLARPEMGIVSLSTNGRRLLTDDTLLDALVARGVVIALQLDGFSPETTGRLRGDPTLGEGKRRLIERVIERGGRVSLTVTLARGVNEHELPAILELFFAHDEIPSIMVQPLAMTAHALRRFEADETRPLTIPCVVDLLVGASGGVLARSDFSPLPCSHPSCFALTYLLKTARGLVSLPSLVDTDAYLDIIKNQALLGTDMETLEKVKDSLYALWSSGGQHPQRDAVLRSVKELLLTLQSMGPTPTHKEVLSVGTDRVKSIFIHDFMDRASFDLSRVMKCCNHYPQADGRLLPACVRNNPSCQGR